LLRGESLDSHGGMQMKRRQIVSHRAKLTPAQVRRLRRDYERGKGTTRELAEKYGVSQATVSNILRGKVYRTVI